MKTLFIAITLSLFSATISAADRDSTEMLSIANKFFSNTSSSKSRNSSGYGKSAVVRKRLSMDKLDVYQSGNNGFVVLARDDNYNAVIGYSDNTAFPDTLPDGLRWWLAKADSSMKSNITKGIVKMSSSEILNSMTTSSTVGTSVAPFVTTKWGQDGAYNLLTPKINDSHTPTGCAATAMAQCLKNIGYPSTSKGTGSYSVSVVDAKKDTTTTKYQYTFGQYVYNWAGMTDSYDGTYALTTSKLAAANAVSQLMVDCGAAAKMNYMSDSSGALIYDVTRGLFDNMQCDSNSIRFYDREFYTDSEWSGLIYEELNAHYPIFYSGQDTDDGGHAFVFDGYDANGNVHVNWGWNGLADGYYDITLLNPNITGYDIKFSEYQMMTTGIRAKSDLRSYKSQWLLYKNLNITCSGNNINYTIGAACNYGTMYFKGLIALVAKNASGGYTVLNAITTGNSYAGTMYGISNYSSSKGISLSYLSDGTYTITLATEGYSGSGEIETTWQPMLAYQGITSAYTLVKNGSTITLTPVKSIQTGIEELEPGITKKGDGITRVYNTQGQILYSAPTSTFSENNIPSSNGLVIIKQGKDVKKITIK
ncbi:C10 family peptidase [Xylanibacter oryzae]|uniref:C10 family peptidase n=1 Tax=Xylanibacter oryzae TaxID=185293 RepID=UPI0004B01F9F|nr:C10 family peptidase [Xylanibacter oryzae]